MVDKALEDDVLEKWLTDAGLDSSCARRCSEDELEELLAGELAPAAAKGSKADELLDDELKLIGLEDELEELLDDEAKAA